MSQSVYLRFSELRVPLKMTFRHASAARTHGESLWVEASRGGHRGYGEGCPRAYVTSRTRNQRQPRNVLIIHRQFHRLPPPCHDTNPRSANHKRGIREQNPGSMHAEFMESMV